MKVKRNFIYKGEEWNLNDNRNGISKGNWEFFPKYRLMLYRFNCWECITCVETKREAIQYIKTMWGGE